MTYSHLQKLKALRDMMTYEMGVTLREYQIEASDLILELALSHNNEELDMLWARQCGKTEAVTDSLLPLMAYHNEVLKQPFRTGVFAPAQSQSIQVFRTRAYERYSRCKGFLEQMGEILVLGESHFSTLYVLKSVNTDIESKIRFMTSSGRAVIKGETLECALMEQVEDLQAEKIATDVFPMMASTGGLKILSGTPSLSVINTYYYDNMRYPAKQRPYKYNLNGINPNGVYVHTVDWQRAAKASEIYRLYCLDQAEKLGVTSDSFRTAYGIEWITLRNKFITFEELNCLVEDYVPNPNLSRAVGWDPARGEDRSVMTCVELDGNMHNHVIAWKEFNGLNWEPQLDEALMFLQHWKPKIMLIDSTGEGDPIPEFTKKWIRERQPQLQNFIDVRGYKYTTESKDAINKFLDAEMHNFRVHFPRGYPDQRELLHFKEDFLNLERNYTGNKLNLDHPKSGQYHNDYCTSLELALWANLKIRFKGYGTVTDLF